MARTPQTARKDTGGKKPRMMLGCPEHRGLLLRHAAAEGDLEELEANLALGANINSQDEDPQEDR